jgi:hypothetical protein
VASETTVMKKKSHRKGKRSHTKAILRLPDLEVAKTAVVNSLSCPGAQRGYRHAIDEFVDWYCSEPRLSFSKRWSHGIGCIWNPAASLPEPLTFVSKRFAFSRLKLRIVDC